MTAALGAYDRHFMNGIAVVFSFANVDPIPDGSVLFTCNIDISPAAPVGVYPLRNSNVLGSTPEGAGVATDAIDGAVIVELVSTPTPTPIMTPTSTRPSAPASLVLEKVRLKADTATKPGRDNGSLSARGIVNANAPFANFVADVLSTGLAVRLTGAGGVDLTLLWRAADCSRRDTSRGPRIKCLAKDANGKRKARFRPTRSPNVFRASISSRGLDFPPPLAADPVTMVVTTASFERRDVIGGCRVRNQGRIVRCKESGFVPTFTPTATPTSTPTHPPTATATVTPPDGTTIIVGDAVGVPGGTAQFIVGLETNADVAGTENEIQFAPSAPLAFTDCQVDTGIDKSLYFTFFPTGCVPDTDCTAMKGLVIDFVNLDPIPNGSTMYSCEIAIFPEAAPGNYLIDCFNPGASDPFGNAIATACSDGNMSVLNGPIDTPTPFGSPAATPTPTAAQSPIATATETAAGPTLTPGCLELIIAAAESPGGCSGEPGPGCVGDCDGDDAVTAQELLIACAIAEEPLPVEDCLAIDANGDGAATFNELVTAACAALNGCP